MTSTLSRYRRDPDLAKGRWVDLPGIDGVQLKIAAQSAEFHRACREANRPHLERFANGEVTNEEQASIWSEAIAKHLLVDWRGNVDEGGQPIEATFEARLREVAHEDAAELRQFIITQSAAMSLYRVASRERILGNSKPASSGS